MAHTRINVKLLFYCCSARWIVIMNASHELFLHCPTKSCFQPATKVVQVCQSNASCKRMEHFINWKRGQVTASTQSDEIIVSLEASDTVIQPGRDEVLNEIIRVNVVVSTMIMVMVLLRLDLGVIIIGVLI